MMDSWPLNHPQFANAPKEERRRPRQRGAAAWKHPAATPASESVAPALQSTQSVRQSATESDGPLLDAIATTAQKHNISATNHYGGSAERWFARGDRAPVRPGRSQAAVQDNNGLHPRSFTMDTSSRERPAETSCRHNKSTRGRAENACFRRHHLHLSLRSHTRSTVDLARAGNGVAKANGISDRPSTRSAKYRVDWSTPHSVCLACQSVSGPQRS